MVKKCMVAAVMVGMLLAAPVQAQAPSVPDYSKIGDAVIQIGQAISIIGGELKKTGGTTPAPTPTPTPTPTPNPKPTPSTSTLTTARLDALKAMAAANSDAWLALKAIADASKTTSPLADDPGLAAAFVYHVTGDMTYSDAAWKQLLAYSALPPFTVYDGVSDGIVEVATVYSIIKDTGTPAQQSQLTANLTVYCNIAVGSDTTHAGGMPASNANYCVPFYFGVAIADSLIGSNYLTQTSNQSGFVMPVGGLDATAADRTTARNCVKQYVTELAVGGTWPEGPYDCKTLPRLLMGWSVLHDLLGVDHFPEIAAWVPQACDAALLDYAKDLQGFYPWGDRNRSGYDYSRRLSIYVALQDAAVRVGDKQRAANMGYLISSILTKLPLKQTDFHFWYFYDPAMAVGTRPADPVVNYSTGVGMLRRADGNSLFAAFFPSAINLNHEQDSQDLFWYTNSEIVLGRPYGYALQLAGIDIPGQTGGNCYGTNGVAVCGLTMMAQSGPLDSGTTADYSYFVGQTKGLMYGPGANKPSVEWLHELTRTVFFLPGKSTLFICDRVDLDDPRTLDLTKYGLPQKQAIQAATHLVEQVWHCPVTPTQAASGISLTWTTAGNQTLTVTSFSSTGGLAVDVVDENVLWANIGAVDASQKKWQFRVRPDADRTWNTVLTCVQLGTAAAPQYVTYQNGTVAGFSLNGYQVLFSVDQNNVQIPAAKAQNVGPAYYVNCTGSNAVIGF